MMRIRRRKMCLIYLGIFIYIIVCTSPNIAHVIEMVTMLMHKSWKRALGSDNVVIHVS